MAPLLEKGKIKSEEIWAKYYAHTESTLKYCKLHIV